jgi:hypothetical protein
MPTQSYLNDGVAFDTDVTNSMGRAFEDACSALQVPAYDIRGRLAIAARIIDLACAGDRCRHVALSGCQGGVLAG